MFQIHLKFEKALLKMFSFLTRLRRPEKAERFAKGSRPFSAELVLQLSRSLLVIGEKIRFVERLITRRSLTLRFQ